MSTTPNDSVGGGIPSLAQTGAQLLAEILAGAEAFLTGAAVAIKIDIPTTKITFTAKNELGTEYNFSFFEKNGVVHLDGTPA
jgi:hypothetical protein